MGLGIAKVHQETITQQLGDMSIIALNDFRTQRLIGTHHVPVLFRVELRGEFGGIHQVAEHDRELATFRFGWSEVRGEVYLDEGCVLSRRLLVSAGQAER